MIKILENLNLEVEYRSELVLMPSGSFSGDPNSIIYNDYNSIQSYGRDYTLTGAIYLYNPMRIPDCEVDSHLIAQDSIQAAEKLVTNFKDSRSAYIKVSEINKYADELIKLGTDLKSRPYDVLVCPLRGALKPTYYLKTMNVIDNEVNWLPFTGASNGNKDALIKEYLKEILNRYSPNNDLFTISVIDTAIGGQGINKLSEIIAKVKSSNFAKSNWIVHFYILHPPPPKTNIQNIESVNYKSKKDLQFVVHRFEVDNLIVEDWEPALGIEINFKGDTLEIKNSIQSGRLFLFNNDSVLVVDSDEMSKYVDVLIASKISEAIETHPGLKFVENVWQDYKFK